MNDPVLAALTDIAERLERIEEHFGIGSVQVVATPRRSPTKGNGPWGKDHDEAILEYLFKRGRDGALFSEIEGALGIPPSPLMSALQRMHRLEACVAYRKPKGKRGKGRWIDARHAARGGAAALDDEYAAVTR